ncbi:MAG TPA: hypothetical protein VHM91_11915 [Verrucomicrobiales bacterium]|nr:hypothetical protein [Verrucomicrobiales bacterium]
MNEPEDNDPAALLLARIRPAAPSAELMQRLLAARPAPAFTRAPERKVIRFLPRLATCAAAFAIAGTAAWFLLPRDSQEVAATPPPAAQQPQVTSLRFLAPQESSQELLGVRDLGFARDAQNRPVRLMHATWRDDDTYRQGDNAPPVRESRVRDEILPVVLTTY